PAAGRLFTSMDREDPGGSRIVVLSHAFWTRRFDSEPSVIGQTVTLNGEPFVVIGVADKEFRGTTVVSSDAWVLIGAKPFDRFFFTSRNGEWGLVGGRLKPGVSVDQAAAEFDAIGAALKQEYPNE